MFVKWAQYQRSCGCANNLIAQILLILTIVAVSFVFYVSDTPVSI